MTGIKKLYGRLNRPTSILPLAIFRMAFGFIMCWSQVRFLAKGWIEESYILPEFHFTYRFFDWVHPFDLTSMYVIVCGSALFALCIGLGLFYRIAAVLFFLSFTYLELLEKSWYLNHYYFASLIAFLLIWLPAHRNLSFDARRFEDTRLNTVPQWTTLILKIQIALVYIFGGIAKLKPDWLLQAQPLKIWLKARTDVPVLGPLFQYDITAYLLSWSGMLYDLGIPFLLFYRRSRPWAYLLVVVFHVLTYTLFNIGMFPWMMIGASLIFITAAEWKQLAGKIGKDIKMPGRGKEWFKAHRMAIPACFAYLAIQCVLPLRHFAFTDNVLWTENGFRFAWHVMVMEKNGFAEFRVVNNKSGATYTVYPSRYLTVIQEKQMSFQPDMIWQFAHFLGKVYSGRGEDDLSIYVNSRVSLNGRGSQVFIDPRTDLLAIPSMDEVYDYIVPLEN